MPRRIEIPCADLRAAYEAGLSTTRLARQYGCTPTTIANHLRRCGVALRQSRFPTSIVPEAALRSLYLDACLPIVAIAAHFGVSVNTIGNWRRRYGIPVRASAQRLSSGT